MQRRYQVFVSSTFVDLREERSQVIQALLELDCIPATMEIFPAADETQWSFIEQLIDDCDYYVVIIGGRYGSTDADGVSFTEREYDLAVARKIPVLGFVHGSPETIPAGKSDMETAARERLQQFREKVRSRLCKTWTTPEELGGVVSRAVVRAMKTHPAEGWVRARYAASAEEMNALRAQIDDLRAGLEAARSTAPAEAERLAKGQEQFRLRYFNSIVADVHSDVVLTWDDIFGAVGPVMLGEASERKLGTQLALKIMTDNKMDMRFPITVAEEDFQTVKFQLFALGLIERIQNKRPANDSETYWVLTPYGERYLTTLKAIPTRR